MAEVFSDDLNLKIGNLLSRPLSTRHPPTLRAPVHSYAIDPSAHLRVCARARSSLRARYTCAPVVAIDLLSRTLYPATRTPYARPLLLRRPNQAHKRMFARAPVDACATATRAHHLLLARDPVHACTRLTRTPAVPCAPPTPARRTRSSACALEMFTLCMNIKSKGESPSEIPRPRPRPRKKKL
jgi:hypothetical protein